MTGTQVSVYCGTRLLAQERVKRLKYDSTLAELLLQVYEGPESSPSCEVRAIQQGESVLSRWLRAAAAAAAAAVARTPYHPCSLLLLPLR
jgi:hypothetical protein